MDIKQIEAALTYIPAHDRDVWWKVGMSVKSELGESGFPLWNEWSQTADTYRQQEARAVWKSLKASGPVTIKSLFGLAKEHGYQPERGAFQPIDPAELLRRDSERKERDRIEQAKTDASHQQAAAKAADLWSKANPHPDHNHAYLTRKGGLPPVGLRQSGDALVVPVHGADKALTGLQFIHADGSKKFLTGTRKAGSWCLLKPEGIPPTDWRVILLAEGWATAASLHTATGHPVFIAFDCGNLPSVAAYIRAQFPEARLLVCADDDAHGKGLHHARNAAHQSNGMAIIPKWEGIPNMTPELQAQATDFNDLHRLAGLDAVRAQIDEAVNDWQQEQTQAGNDSPVEEPEAEIEVHRNAPKGTPEMLYGIFGEIGRIAADGTEVNPFAACMNAMVFFSACVGRGVFLNIGNKAHHVRLFALHVGRSSYARKGDGLSLQWRINKEMERLILQDGDAFSEGLIPRIHTGGLSSREGLAAMLHDGYKHGKDEVAPIFDKRLWIVEEEFANVLHQTRRDGNTLSSALREGWDGGSIKPATKGQGMWASDPHFAISGAITPHELGDLMSAREMSNGFANRFIIFWAERTGLTPYPETTPSHIVSELARKTLAIIAFAKGDYCWDSDPGRSSQNNRQMGLTPDAAKLYADLYRKELNKNTDGQLVGGLTARRPPYLLRMAALFALSDLTLKIDVQHIRAALAWVRYWRESVKFIFNDAKEEAEQAKTCDKAERLYQWLKTRNKPTTRTEITNECFSKRGGGDVDKAIDTLLRDTPPRIEVIEGEKSTNGKRTKFYTACGLGGTGGADCSATVSPTPHGCGLGGAGFKSDTVNNQARNPSPPTPQACGLAASIAAQPTPPTPPTPQGLNEYDDAEVEL